MRKLAFKMSLLAIGCLFMLGSTSFALPLADQDAMVTRVDGYTLGGASGGGEFLIKTYDSVETGIGTSDFTGDEYISFCLEFDEHIRLDTRYNIESAQDFATDGGGGADANGEDVVSDKTKWLFWNYLYNTTDANVARDGDTMANAVQRVIWFYENEDGSTYVEGGDNTTAESTFFSSYATAFDLYTYVELQGDYSITGNVKVLNLVNADGDAKQSQLIAEPVPEPATMLLFGTGLIGLAGVARRRSNKK